MAASYSVLGSFLPNLAPTVSDSHPLTKAPSLPRHYPSLHDVEGSAQIDVKISFKGRQPNKESAAKPLCRYVPRPRPCIRKGTSLRYAFRR